MLISYSSTSASKYKPGVSSFINIKKREIPGEDPRTYLEKSQQHANNMPEKANRTFSFNETKSPQHELTTIYVRKKNNETSRQKNREVTYSQVLNATVTYNNKYDTPICRTKIDVPSQMYKARLDVDDYQSKRSIADLIKQLNGEFSRDLCFYKDQTTFERPLKASTQKLLKIMENIETNSLAKIHTDTDGPTEHVSKKDAVFISNVEYISSALSQMMENKLLLHEFNEEANSDTSCSVYYKLIGKCHCLNRPEYNDLEIHFNARRPGTSTDGEIIKNMNIVKKFLYMGGTYTKNALNFLAEAFMTSSYKEKLHILVGCSHSDVCNVFDGDSIVTALIKTLLKYKDPNTESIQMTVANLLYRMAIMEEGKRYLNFTTKIKNNIKLCLRHGDQLSSYTSHYLKLTLSVLLNQTISEGLTVHYHCKAEEGMAHRTLFSLLKQRENMTMDEIMTSLILLSKLSSSEIGKQEILTNFEKLLVLFKSLIVEYDCIDINTEITQILSRIVAKPKEIEGGQKDFMVTYCDRATEPIQQFEELKEPDPKQKKITKYEGNRFPLRKEPIPKKIEGRRKEPEQHPNNKNVPRQQLVVEKKL